MCQVCQDDSRTARPISETTCLREFGGYGACLNPKGHDGDCTDANGHTFTGDMRQSEEISVPSPDDEDMIDAPIFEGTVAKSTERLVPGVYVAWVIATEEYGILKITERYGRKFARMFPRP